MNFFIFLLVLVLILFPCISENKSNQNQENVKYIYHTSDNLFYDAKSKVVELKGNVNIYYSDTKVRSDFFRYYEERKYGIAEGNPRLYNPRAYMRAEFVELFFDNKQAIAKNNVYIKLKNDKKDKDKKWEYFEIFCNELVYNWEKQNIFIPNGVKIVSKDLYLTANQLIYNDKTRILILKGNVNGKQKDQSIRAEKVTYDLDKEFVKIEGNVKSVIRVSESVQTTDQRDSETSEQKLIHLQTKEIYDNVLRENRRIVDYFISSMGGIPNIDIYLNYYTRVEVYKHQTEYHFYNVDLANKHFVFLPFYPKISLEYSYPDKFVGLYVYPANDLFFENYKECLEFIKDKLGSGVHSDKGILFTSFDGFKIVNFEEQDKVNLNREFLYHTYNKVAGYFFEFPKNIEFFEIFKSSSYSRDKNIFFILGKNFWQNISDYERIVFNKYDFNVNILLDVNQVESFNYNPDEYYKFLFWKSYLYGCKIYVNKMIYSKVPYFRILTRGDKE
ncbi:MAG: LptA/OstA family protein [bacterium]